MAINNTILIKSDKMKTKPNLAEPKLAKSKSQEAKAIKKDSGKQDASIKAKNVRKNKVSASQRQQLNDPLLLKSSSKTESKRKEEAKKKNKEEEKEVCTKATALSSSLYGKPKPFTKHTTKVAKITEWIEITIDELHKVLLEDRKHNKDIDEEEICPICRWELYDDILKMKKDEINKIQTDQLSGKLDIEVVRFKSWSR